MENKRTEWRTKNGYAKIGDMLEFSSYNSITGKPGERATIIKAIPITGDVYDTLIFDDKTRCCSDKLWDAKIV